MLKDQNKKFISTTALFCAVKITTNKNRIKIKIHLKDIIHSFAISIISFENICRIDFSRQARCDLFPCDLQTNSGIYQRHI